MGQVRGQEPAGVGGSLGACGRRGLLSWGGACGGWEKVSRGCPGWEPGARVGGQLPHSGGRDRALVKPQGGKLRGPEQGQKIHASSPACAGASEAVTLPVVAGPVRSPRTEAATLAWGCDLLQTFQRLLACFGPEEHKDGSEMGPPAAGSGHGPVQWDTWDLASVSQWVFPLSAGKLSASNCRTYIMVKRMSPHRGARLPWRVRTTGLSALL